MLSSVYSISFYLNMYGQIRDAKKFTKQILKEKNEMFFTNN